MNCNVQISTLGVGESPVSIHFFDKKAGRFCHLIQEQRVENGSAQNQRGAGLSAPWAVTKIQENLACLLYSNTRDPGCFSVMIMENDGKLASCYV